MKHWMKKLILVLLVMTMVASSFVTVAFGDDWPLDNEGRFEINDQNCWGSLRISGLHDEATVKFRHIIRANSKQPTGWEFWPRHNSNSVGTGNVMYWFALAYGIDQGNMSVSEWEQEVLRAVIADYSGSLSDENRDNTDAAIAAINGSEKFRKALQYIVEEIPEVLTYTRKDGSSNDLDGTTDGSILLLNELKREDQVGVYLIYPTSTNEHLYTPTAAFVNFNYNSAQGNGNLYSIDQVTAKAKSTSNIVNKTSTDESLSIGDTASYTITSTYPTFAEQYKDTAIYTISDTSEQLEEYVISSVKVGTTTYYQYDPNKGFENGKKYYTFEKISNSPVEGFRITLLDSNVTGAVLPAYDDSNAGKTVEVKYTAKVKTLDNGKVKNIASVTTKPDSNSDAWTTESIVITDTYEVHLTKVYYPNANDKSIKHTLSGAIFQAVKSDGTYVKWSYNSETKTYTVSGYTDDATDSYTKITFESRIGVTLAGLDAEETYTISEIHAPNGYVISSNKITLGQSNISLGLDVNSSERQYKNTQGINTSEKSTTVDTTGDTTFNIDYPNSKVFQLPETGLWGTYIFTLVGVAIIVTAIIIVRRKKRAEA